MKATSKYVFLIAALLICLSSLAQNTSVPDSLPNFKKRKILLITGTSVIGGGTLLYLNYVWFQHYSTGSFHTFNDNAEWYGMDKCGHAYTNFQASRMMINSFKWAGFSKKKQMWIGGTIGLGYMTVVELMDGFSSGWGFSWGDMAANGLGTAASISQYALWNEQRVNLKFSFFPGTMSRYNPDLLGSNLAQEFIKDYNSQTYWLSVSPFTFCKNDKLPRWLAVSFGYGAANMIGARTNDNVYFPSYLETPGPRSRQYYLSLDVDFSKIKTRSKFLRSLFNTLNLIKVPFPTLEFQGGKTKFHYIYF